MTITAGTPHELAEHRAPRAWVADTSMVLAGLGFGAVVALHIATRHPAHSTGDVLTEVGRLTGLTGTYVALLVVLLAARIPLIEKEVGQDRLIKWHRVTGPYAIWMIVAHFIFITLGYAMTYHAPLWSELWNSLILGMPEMVKGAIGFLLFVFVGVLSYRRIRRRLQYEYWWLSHLTIYIGIIFAYSHQVVSGQAFKNQPLAANVWIAYIFGSLGLLVLFRWLMPLVYSMGHDLRVERVVHETEDTVSVYIAGRDLDKMNVAGGQFFMFRFMTSKLWWHAHPYSISAAPNGTHLRVTIRDLGDTSRALFTIPVGTRVIAEGPYGTFTARNRRTNSLLLIAGGIGVTPIRAVLEELPEHASVDVLYRVYDRSALVFAKELDTLAAERKNTRVRFLVGSRKDHPIDARNISRLVPNAAHSDWYVCGPHSLVDAAKASAEVLGVPANRIHNEEFAFLP